MALRERQTCVLKIKRMGINGEGIGFYQKTLVFVKGALKGEEVFCKITKVKRNFAEARILQINKPSKYRVLPACRIYDECGGCQIMHLRYDRQLEFKRDLLRQALKKFKPEGYENYDLRPTIGMEEPWHYRGKLQFQTREMKGQVKAGLFAEGSHRLVALEGCLVQDEVTQAVVNACVQLLDNLKLPIYNERRIQGVRTIMVRQGQASGDVQVIIVTSKALRLSPFVKQLTQQHPEVKSIAVNLNTSKSSQIYGDQTEIIWGQDSIKEEVLSYRFSLSPRAFYQLNPQQTNVLYDQAVKALAIKKEDRLIDAYCGVGTIGFAFADKVAEVRGMDVIPEAIQDAKANARALGFANTHYEAGLAEDIIPRWYQEGFRADCLVVDPPRTGLDDKLLETLAAFPPERMVYVSCNVSTLARDLVVLAKHYHIDYIQSVDMFPHTARTEAVVKLQRKV